MLDFLSKSVGHSVLVAIFQATIFDSYSMNHRVSIKPVLTPVRRNELWIWAIPEVDPRYILRN